MAPCGTGGDDGAGGFEGTDGGGVERELVGGVAGAFVGEGEDAIVDHVDLAGRVFLLEEDDVVVVLLAGVVALPVSVETHVFGGVDADVLVHAVLSLVAR